MKIEAEREMKKARQRENKGIYRALIVYNV